MEDQGWVIGESVGAGRAYGL